MKTAIVLQAATSGIETSTYLFFLGLAVCVALFFYFLKRTDNILKKENEQFDVHDSQPTVPEIELEEEAAAAIALAISMYKSQVHDMEHFTITLKKVSRIYSPWSSKIYTLRQLPRR
jgi:type III secretory pathway component EscV